VTRRIEVWRFAVDPENVQALSDCVVSHVGYSEYLSISGTLQFAERNAWSANKSLRCWVSLFRFRYQLTNSVGEICQNSTEDFSEALSPVWVEGMEEYSTFKQVPWLKTEEFLPNLFFCEGPWRTKRIVDVGVLCKIAVYMFQATKLASIGIHNALFYVIYPIQNMSACVI
jgi:hypothetical protein